MTAIIFQIALIGLLIAGVFFLNRILFLHENYLDRLVQHFPGGHVSRSGGLLRERVYSYHGRYQGRHFDVLYLFSATTDRSGGLVIRIPIIQKFWLRLVAGGKTPAFEGFNLEKYIVHSDAAEAASEFLFDRFVHTQFATLEYEFDKLEFHRGWLRMSFIDPQEQGLKASGLENILDRLMKLILCYESQMLNLTIMVSSASELCPYCRSKFAESEAVLQCRGCGTHLHQACWKENGQCTTWGCRSTYADRL